MTVAIVAIVLLTAMNLRGVRESGAFFAVPTYLFMFAILGMCAYGLLRLLAGDLPDAESAQLVIEPQQGWEEPLTQIGLMFLLARAFSSGCAALTGVEAISNGVPAFRKPKSRNAATTLLLLALISISMMMSVIVLAKQMSIRFVDPHHLERLRTAAGGSLPEGYEQHPVISQIAAGVFDHFPPGFYFVVTVTGIILVLAANTAFNGFPVLGSILAQDGLAPRSLGSRGDRLAYSNGIVFLAGHVDPPDLGLRRRDDEADPALHRRCLRVLQPQPARHDPPLDPAPEERDRPDRTAPDDALARDQHVRPRHDGRRPASSCSSRSSSPGPGSRSWRWASSSW